jgi:uncharacterized protein YgiM (DUF1202 family)
MLVTALIAGLASSAVAPSKAHADETVRTNMEASLRARPGERAPTLAHLDEGQTVRVLGRQGRWLKVSVKGKVGWITRTQVDDAEPASSARSGGEKKRTVGAKARKKGWSSMDDEAVGADAVEGEDEESAPAEDEKEEAVQAREEPKAEEMKKEEAKSEPVEKTASEDAEKGEKAKKVAAKPRKKAEKIAKGGEVVALRTTTVHAKPSKKSDEKWDASKGTKMTVVAISAEGDWVKVKDADGEKGWVASKDLQARGGDDEDDSSAGDAIAGGDSDSMGDEGKGVRRSTAPRGPMVVWAAANAGVLAKTQTYRSDGDGLAANYAINNTAPAVVGQIGLTRKMGTQLVLGADASIAATIGGSGIQVSGQDGALGWKAVQIEAHGDVGYMLSPKYQVSGRVGYHVSAVTVDYSPEALLPSETLSGVTLGAAFYAPKLTEKLGAHLGAEYLLGASLLQTDNLNDGDSSTASVIFVNAGMNYQLTAGLSANMTYEMAYESFAWTGINERQADASNARRIDIQHIVGFGVAYAF